MAEPIRQPVHRPRPPHPHAQNRPRAVLVRSRLVPEEPDSSRLTLLPPPRVDPANAPAPPPPRTPPTDLAPLEELPVAELPSSTCEQAPRRRSARRHLLAALALHTGVLLTLWLGPAPDLAAPEMALAGSVLLSGGMMIVLGRR